MKKIFTIAAIAVSVSAFAQRNVSNITSTTSRTIGNTFAAKADTLLLPGAASDTACSSLATYTFNQGGQPGGFITGVNVFADAEKGQVFSTNLPGASVTGAIGFFAIKAVMTPAGAADNYVAKVYSLNSTDTTVTLLGTSLPVALSAIDTTFGPSGPAATPFLFASPVSVPSTFVVTFEVVKLNANDSITSGVVLYSFEDGCGDGAFEIWNDGTPSYISAAWGLNTDLLTAVSIQYGTVGLDNNVAENSFSMFPNPASNNATINYNLTEGGKVTMQVTNMAGQVVMNLNEGVKGAGNYTRNLDLSSLSNGIYVYSINVDGKISKGKFVVAK
ncbi:MAG: T9SS type A sorting domain-containing protein [Bacteroidia bacterium]|nr:T9SS type A sorting domain-containing protein [Bacteroidia bacterium]